MSARRRPPPDEAVHPLHVTHEATASRKKSTVTSPSSNKDEAHPTGNAKNFSAFLARVLEQLSVTSWMPSVFLVGNAAILLTLKDDKTLSIGGAVQRLVHLEWGALVVLVFAIIIAAIVIQAFEFETLRFLEGYYRSRLLRKWTRRRIDYFQRRRRNLENRTKQLEQLAFVSARKAALRDRRTTASERRAWKVLEKVVHQRRLTAQDRQLLAEARDLDWPTYASPADLHAWNVANMRLEEFPADHRVLPTRLGNIMRAAEDDIELGGDDGLEGYMIRNIDRLPPTIVSEHSDYRSRLEMYCGLMFVMLSLSALAAFCLWGRSSDWIWQIGVPIAYLASVWICYRAALASALGFGLALKEANKWLLKNPDEIGSEQSGS